MKLSSAWRITFFGEVEEDEDIFMCVCVGA